MTRLVPDNQRRRWSDRNLAKKKFSCSTFMLYLGIEGRYDLPHHNIYVARDYERNLDDIESRHALSSDPSFYVQNASVTDPSLAPAGMSTLYILAPVTQQHANVDWTKEQGRFRKLLLQQIEKAGFKNVERRIRFERMITPNDWDERYEIHLGATFNLSNNLRQLLHLRPRNRFEDIDGVYLVGGGTHPGSGLPVIFESARIKLRARFAPANRVFACWRARPFRQGGTGRTTPALSSRRQRTIRCYSSWTPTFDWLPMRLRG